MRGRQALLPREGKGSREGRWEVGKWREAKMQRQVQTTTQSGVIPPPPTLPLGSGRVHLTRGVGGCLRSHRGGGGVAKNSPATSKISPGRRGGGGGGASVVVQKRQESWLKKLKRCVDCLLAPSPTAGGPVVLPLLGLGMGGWAWGSSLRNGLPTTHPQVAPGVGGLVWMVCLVGSYVLDTTCLLVFWAP